MTNLYIRAVRGSIVGTAVFVALTLLTGCGSSTKTTASQADTRAGAPAATKTASATTTTVPSTETTPTTTTPTDSTPATHTTPAKREPERSPPATLISLSSPALDPNDGQLQSHYTCNGSDTPLPLKWEGVPSGTKELMIDVMPVKAVNDKLQFVWAVAHIPSTAHEIVDGKLPAGAIVGTNSNGEVGYRLCPPKASSESYVAVIFSLAHSLPATAGFDPRALRRLAEQQATHQKLLIFSYEGR